MAKWAEKTGLAVKSPANIAEADVQSEIRAHLAAVKGNRIGFVQQHVTDPRAASARTSVLSGLTHAEVGVVRNSIEQHVAPEIVEARTQL